MQANERMQLFHSILLKPVLIDRRYYYSITIIETTSSRSGYYGSCCSCSCRNSRINKSLPPPTLLPPSPVLSVLLMLLLQLPRLEVPQPIACFVSGFYGFYLLPFFLPFLLCFQRKVVLLPQLGPFPAILLSGEMGLSDFLCAETRKQVNPNLNPVYIVWETMCRTMHTVYKTPTLRKLRAENSHTVSVARA